jgi:large subunit ribosomal protein L3
MNTLFGIKQTMLQTWNTNASRLPVTVVALKPMTVTQVKNTATDGYQAVQVGFGARSSKRVTKPLLNHLKKTAKDIIPQYLKEIRLTTDPDLKVGDVIDPAKVFELGDMIKVTGVSKGRGFAGAVKRYGFKGGPRTHGQSDRERAPGAIGQGTSPGRIHKGKRMAGHYGVEQFTLKNIQIIKIDPATSTLWLAGPIPGHIGSLVTLTKIRSGKFVGLHQTEPIAPLLPTKADPPVSSESVTQATSEQKISSEKTTLKAK